MQDTHWLSAYPEKATTSNATYTLDDGYIYLYFPETDYKNTLEYYWVGSELIVCFYVGSGRDEGNTRIYQKQDHGQETSGITIPDKVPSKKEIPSSTKSITSGMKNALQRAKDYLAVMPFSHSGLVEQLEYEGYSHSEATYAADNCGADWYAQAVKSARNYLDVMSFSRSGLIEQLEYEGFTHDQAVYGVDKVY